MCFIQNSMPPEILNKSSLYARAVVFKAKLWQKDLCTEHQSHMLTLVMHIPCTAGYF